MSAPRDTDLSALRTAIEALPTWDKRSVPGGLHVKRADVLALLDSVAPAPRETAAAPTRDDLLAMSDADFEAWLEQRGIAGRVREAEREAAPALPPWEWWERELFRRSASSEGMAQFVTAKVKELTAPDSDLLAQAIAWFYGDNCGDERAAARIVAEYERLRAARLSASGTTE